jgi:hypothetical protein
MRTGWYVAIAAGLAIGAAPASVEAQRGPARAAVEARERAAERARERQSEQRRNERDRANDRYDQRDRYDIFGRQQQQQQRGPAFCRSGEGHPVFGRQWCRDKGFGLGNDRGVLDPRRDRGTWEDIIFGPQRDRRYDRDMNRSVLGDVLGAVMVGQLESYGRQFASGPISGRWLPDNRANVLQLSLGSTPFARLIDSNRDGRVDDVVLRR